MADTPAGPARPSELVQENAAEVATPNPLGSLMGLGSIGSTLNVVRDLLSGKPVDQIEIPADVQEQALHVIMQQYGASTMEEFITNPEIMAQNKVCMTIFKMPPTQPIQLYSDLSMAWMARS